MLDPARRGYLLDALHDMMRVTCKDLPRVDAEAAELLRRFGITWRDVLVQEPKPEDPLPVRQAACLTTALYLHRQHAEPGWLVLMALRARQAAGGDIPAMETLMTGVAEVQRREQRQLAELRTAYEAGDWSTVTAISDRMEPFCDEPAPAWLERYEVEPPPPLEGPPVPVVRDVPDGTCLIGRTAAEGAR